MVDTWILVILFSHVLHVHEGLLAVVWSWTSWFRKDDTLTTRIVEYNEAIYAITDVEIGWYGDLALHLGFCRDKTLVVNPVLAS